jgi:ATP-binding cassette subfamily F protein 3
VALLTIQNLEKSFGDRVIFHGLNFLIDPGERVGLIGDNGSGKTTLFKIITGETMPEAGEVSLARSAKLGYLAQDATFHPANTVMDEAELAFAELHALSHKLREAEHEMADHSGDTLEKTLRRYQQLQHEFDLAGGYAWRHRLEATLLGVGLARESWDLNVEKLSGGQRSRLNLAKLLIAAPDLLLLDEPTNHLDLAAIEWLEKYLLDYRGAVFLISHDRFLLDRLATRIAWLTRQALQSYRGNYSAFVQQREVQELSQQRAFEQQQADIEKQKEFIRRFGAGQRSKEAKGREKRLNRLLKSEAMIDSVTQTKKMHLAINTDQRAGDRVLDVRDISKAYDAKKLWEHVTFELLRGDRAGIIGPNGSGKTTLLRVLLGEEEAHAGKIRWGANLNIGYYDQRLDDFDPDRTVFEEVGDGRVIKDQALRDILAMMLFRGDDVHKPMGLLSGGERARVALAELLLDKPNVLLLDEPTNHLDINSREALENALAGFSGTILCVSHDRYFLGKIIKRLLVIEPPRVIDFPDDYRAWIDKTQNAKRATAGAAPALAKSQAAARKSVSKSDNPYARPYGRLALEDLEKQITQTEIEIAEHQQLFADTNAFKEPARGKKLRQEYDLLGKKLKDLEAEYFRREH